MNYKEKLALYKKDVLGISKAGEFNYKGEVYLKEYILPICEADKNIMIGKSEYRYLKSNFIELNKKFSEVPIQIRLHRYCYHLNSSQMLALNFFYEFLDDKKKLDTLLKFFGINETAKEATLEYELNDKSEIDLAVKLGNDKYVYVEIKYSESEFGSASSKTTNYLMRKNSLYSKVSISFDDFKKHYQFVRNIILGLDGNYSVFLVPRFNKSIIKNYSNSLETISNAKIFDTRLVFWEDLLNVIPNDKVKEKYFDGITEW